MAEGKGDVFVGVEVREQIKGLEDDADGAAVGDEIALVVEVDDDLVELDFAGVWCFERGEDSQQRRFATS